MHINTIHTHELNAKYIKVHYNSILSASCFNACCPSKKMQYIVFCDIRPAPAAVSDLQSMRRTAGDKLHPDLPAVHHRHSAHPRLLLLHAMSHSNSRSSTGSQIHRGTVLSQLTYVRCVYTTLSSDPVHRIPYILFCLTSTVQRFQLKLTFDCTLHDYPHSKELPPR